MPTFESLPDTSLVKAPGIVCRLAAFGGIMQVDTRGRKETLALRLIVILREEEIWSIS
jgi:hypothetical protein